MSDKSPEGYEGPFDTKADTAMAAQIGPGAYLFTGLFSAVAAIFCFVVGAIVRSSYIHEGGDPSAGPNGFWILAILFGVLVFASLILGLRAESRARS